jgi:hypothetical protein
MTTADDSFGTGDAIMAGRALQILNRRVDRGVGSHGGWEWPAALIEFCDADPALGALFRFAMSRSWDAHRAGAIADQSGQVARHFRALQGEQKARRAIAEAIEKLEAVKAGLMSSMEQVALDTDLATWRGHDAEVRAGMALVIGRVTEEIREQQLKLEALARETGAEEELGEFSSLFGLAPRARSAGLKRQCLALAASGVQHKEIAFILDLRGNDPKQIVETVRNRLKRGRKRGRQPPDEMT